MGGGGFARQLWMRSGVGLEMLIHGRDLTASHTFDVPCAAGTEQGLVAALVAAPEGGTQR